MLRPRDAGLQPELLAVGIEIRTQRVESVLASFRWR
ncbi:tRNA G46 methylase TrmB [Nocardioides salarius]|uniref:tRNA G46 methylase TrmB n=1 Tax=Nocardioides salarius TaxID=374513 RepID=A0ABS2MDH8_9ACTN|nr:tRNA G46 methylase TrmB [Nocardioides salarius]